MHQRTGDFGSLCIGIPKSETLVSLLSSIKQEKSESIEKKESMFGTIVALRNGIAFFLIFHLHFVWQLLRRT